MPVGKREIGRAFGLHGADKIALKAQLKVLIEAGSLHPAPGRTLSVTPAGESGALPRVGVLKVVAVDDEGVARAVLAGGNGSEAGPLVTLRERSPHHTPGKRQAKGRSSRALGEGDRVLARIEQRGSRAIGHVMKRLEPEPEAVLGVLQREGDGLILVPTDKRLRTTFAVPETAGASAGELVRAEPISRRRGWRATEARVTERLGDPLAQKSLSLIAIHARGLPDCFSAELLKAADKVSDMSIDDHVDRTDMPFIAIDPLGARDHDDAIWAESMEEGGWRIAVAIADVSWFVRPGSALDQEARKRGNSAYFPDRVVPMLPEALSGNACSLKAGRDRAALVCMMTLSAQGRLLSAGFERARICLAANVTYEEAQRQIDAGEGLVHDLLTPLWGAWRALCAARDARGPLEIDLPERIVRLNADGSVAAIEPRARLDAHRVVEDFMIAANVAAAQTLEKAASPCVYRVHEPPTRENLVALKDYLSSLDQPFALGQVVKPALFNRLLEQHRAEPWAEQLQQQVLRTQTQAYYGTENTGHFGLSLRSYAHFTSPIRRYSDLLVHRLLVRALRLGAGGMTDADLAELDRTSDHISMTERRAMEAERDTVDRYIALYMSAHVGAVMTGTIASVTRFGLFVRVQPSGADGLLPMASLGDERFDYFQEEQAIEGRSTGQRFTLGDTVQVRLLEAERLTGAIRFGLADSTGRDRSPRRSGPRRPPQSYKRRG